MKLMLSNAILTNNIIHIKIKNKKWMRNCIQKKNSIMMNIISEKELILKVQNNNTDLIIKEAHMKMKMTKRTKKLKKDIVVHRKMNPE